MLNNYKYACSTGSEYGYIVTDEDMAASIPGLYAEAGAKKTSARQIPDATGSGAVAAIFTEKYIH